MRQDAIKDLDAGATAALDGSMTDSLLVIAWALTAIAVNTGVGRWCRHRGSR